MTTAGSIEQKVRQLDNDVHAIYGMITEISLTQKRHTNRLQEITEDLAALKANVAAHDARFDAMDGRFAAIEGKLDAHDGRFAAIEGKLDAHDGRFAAIEGKLDAHDGRFAAIEGKLDRVLEVLER